MMTMFLLALAFFSESMASLLWPSKNNVSKSNNKDNTTVYTNTSLIKKSWKVDDGSWIVDGDKKKCKKKNIKEKNKRKK